MDKFAAHVNEFCELIRKPSLNNMEMLGIIKRVHGTAKAALSDQFRPQTQINDESSSRCYSVRTETCGQPLTDFLLSPIYRLDNVWEVQTIK